MLEGFGRLPATLLVNSTSFCFPETFRCLSDGGINFYNWYVRNFGNFTTLGEGTNLPSPSTRRVKTELDFLQTKTSPSKNIYYWEIRKVAEGSRGKVDELKLVKRIKPKMTVGPLVTEITCTFIVAASILYRYGDWFRHHLIVTLSVLIAWYFSFLIIFILPLDVTSVSLDSIDYLWLLMTWKLSNYFLIVDCLQAMYSGTYFFYRRTAIKWYCKCKHNSSSSCYPIKWNFSLQAPLELCARKCAAAAVESAVLDFTIPYMVRWLLCFKYEFQVIGHFFLNFKVCASTHAVIH